MTGLLAQAAPPPTNGAQLVLAALIGIAVIVVLITRFSVHPFLSLTIGSLATAAVAGQPLDAAITSYSNGFGSTAPAWAARASRPASSSRSRRSRASC